MSGLNWGGQATRRVSKEILTEPATTTSVNQCSKQLSISTSKMNGPILHEKSSKVKKIQGEISSFQCELSEAKSQT
jgi:hypothetical protein